MASSKKICMTSFWHIDMREQLLQILTDLRPEFDFTEDVNFIEEGMLDSFDMVALVADLESAFDVKIDGVDIVPENFCSLEALEKLIKNSKKAWWISILNISE